MFKFRKASNVGNAPEIIQVPATNAESYVVGETLHIASGKATKASGTVAPEYVCVEKKTAKTGDEIHVYLLEHNQEYETELSASGSVAVGDKVTIDSTGTKVTATTTSGVAEIVSVAGTASGSKVIVRF